MRALLIPPGYGHIVQVDIAEKNPLRDLYAYIHCDDVQPATPGYLTERLTIRYFPEVTMLFDGEARMKTTQPYNERASRLYGYDWHRGTLLGPVIMLGHTPPIWTDLPEGWTVDNLTAWLRHRNDENLEKLGGSNAARTS